MSNGHEAAPDARPAPASARKMPVARPVGEQQRPLALRSAGGVVRAGVADARKLLPEEIDTDVGGDEEDLCQLAVPPGAAGQPVQQDAVAHAVRQQVHLAPGAVGERLDEAAEGDPEPRRRPSVSDQLSPRQDLQRKETALAEAAALLVL